ncbi:Hypothetical protein SMAX5B_015656 [Scophthalmus maximus]|uniref:Uncharacterized protein n=1 Tax=Scophthalmus maximus TaxID=52904 RepID=A0A2U9D3K9_SCOMX|nr:Hypothetical protein SMAX5B_015656 [Scophthalmus maximus]
MVYISQAVKGAALVHVNEFTQWKGPIGLNKETVLHEAHAGPIAGIHICQSRVSEVQHQRELVSLETPQQATESSIQQNKASSSI